MKYALVLSLIFLPALGSAQMYKWTDADGVVHYTDRQPDKNIKQDVLPDRLRALGARKAASSESEAAYTVFQASKPAADSTIRNDKGTVDIAFTIEPPMTEFHFLQVYLDGLEVGEKTKSTALTLHNVKKGIHRLQAGIVDADGQQVMKTEEIRGQ